MNEEPNTRSTLRFIKGLATYNVGYLEIKNGKWKYCGGNDGRHLKYFELLFPSNKYEKPDLEKYCICGHTIKENCYIKNDNEEFLILGNCCIKRFLPAEKQGRTCGKCGVPHMRRKSNYCKDCELLKRVCLRCDVVFFCEPGQLICKPNGFGSFCVECYESIPTVCGKCNNSVCVHKVKKESPNKGLLFYKCESCNNFVWIN